MHTKLVRTAVVGAALAVGIPTALAVGTSVAGAHATRPVKVPDNPVAGFVSTSPSATTTESTTLVVPSASCPSQSATLASGVAIWDSTTPPFGAVGQAPASAVLQIQCTKGSLIQYVSGTAGLASFRFPVNPGDSIHLGVTQGAGTGTATATDTTTGSTESASSAAAGTPAVDVLGSVSASNSIPTITGGSVAFSAATIDGTLLDAGAQPENLVKRNAVVLTASPAAGGDFTITQP